MEETVGRIESEDHTEPKCEPCSCSGCEGWIWHYVKYSLCMGAVITCKQCGGTILKAATGIGVFDGMGKVVFLNELNLKVKAGIKNKLNCEESVNLNVPVVDDRHPFAELFRYQWRMVVKYVSAYDGGRNM